MKYRFEDDKVITIAKKGEIRTSRVNALIRYDFAGDCVELGIGGSGLEEDTSYQVFRSSDLRETADFLNFLADELDKEL